MQSVNLGSPAFLAGLFAGDMIVEVDGVNVSRCPMEEVVKVFKAEKPGETMFVHTPHAHITHTSAHITHITHKAHTLGTCG